MKKKHLALWMVGMMATVCLAGCSSTAEESSSSSSQQTVEVNWEALSVPDFLVTVKTGKDPVVLQLSDTQIIDAGQCRYNGRLGAYALDYWGTDKVEARCYQYVRETIEAVQPDLILLTGDNVYGEFDDAGTVLADFVEFMDSFKIPWVPIMGNHDIESKKGADWISRQYENAEYCLFEQKGLTGNGNYSVGIAQGGQLKRVFYMLDSNGTGAISAESVANGHSVSWQGFGQDQIDWYTAQITELRAVSPETKISFAYHIPSKAVMDAYKKYGYTDSGIPAPINIDTHPDKAEGDFGILGEDGAVWDADYKVWNGMKALGVDSVFVGHEHCNSASVVCDGVRFQFGQKSSAYDKLNQVDMATGRIFGADGEVGTQLIGGTVLPLDEADGSLKAPYIYLCENAGGDIDWDQWK